MHSLMTCCAQSVTFDFELRAIHMPGSLIGMLDAISRLHETRQPERLVRLLLYWHHSCPSPTPITAHMWPSYHFLCQQMQQRNWRRHCRLK